MEEKKQQKLEIERERQTTSELIRNEYSPGSLMSHNVEYGFLEGVVRGLRSGFITETEYKMLGQSESLDDIKLNLGDTDYQSAVSNLSALSVNAIKEVCQDKYVKEFKWLQSNAVGVLATFLEFMTYGKLIDSIQSIIHAIIRGNNDPEALIEDTDPLGRSPHLRHILVFNQDHFRGTDEKEDAMIVLYQTVLVETPVAPYFAQYFGAQLRDANAADAPREVHKAYTEREIPIITEMIMKLYLEDFYKYCQSLGGDTATIMCQLLEFEADRRAMAITENSFSYKRASLNEQAGRDLRKHLYCSFGELYPATVKEWKEVSDKKSFADALQASSKTYYDLWNEAETSGNSFQHALAQYEVKLLRAAFDGQSHFACYYAWLKLKEVELNNITYICKIIHQHGNVAQAALRKVIPIFEH